DLLTLSAAAKRNSEQAFSVGPTRCANGANGETATSAPCSFTELAPRFARRSVAINRLKLRHGTNVAAVALANHNARVLWALLTRGEDARIPSGPGHDCRVRQRSDICERPTSPIVCRISLAPRLGPYML